MLASLEQNSFAAVASHRAPWWEEDADWSEKRKFVFTFEYMKVTPAPHVLPSLFAGGQLPNLAIEHLAASFLK